MTKQLYARVNRHRTHVVCGVSECGARLATLERAGATFVVNTMEVGGPVIGQRVIQGDEVYVELMSGFMAANTDEVWRVSMARRDYWRRRGKPPQPRPAHGDDRAIPELPTRVECLDCLRIQILDAGHLALAASTT